MTSVNGARGEVALEVAGVSRTLCLTLGALAEIETAFGCNSMAELQARLRSLSASELGIVVQALLRGGGTPEEVISVADISPGDAANAVAEAFRAALG
ncbi:MAG: GTA-gp10 family protein [Henriciella sp.]